MQNSTGQGRFSLLLAGCRGMGNSPTQKEKKSCLQKNFKYKRTNKKIKYAHLNIYNVDKKNKVYYI